MQKSKNCHLINGYGPDKNTTFTGSLWELEVAQLGNSVPIGRPIANTQVYILDPYLQPVPIGIPGELYIGGDGLARGYLNRPELTKEKFISNPFGSGKLYKTGDLVRYLTDGNIEFLGRIDQQVKIRGFRIELGEIETVILQHPQVKEAVVIAREDHPGDQRLLAYVVFPEEEEQGPTSDQLRHFLKEKLPNYMVPSVFVFLDALPLTPNGKVNRRALPAPDLTRQELTETFVAPRDDWELQLLKIWEKVLEVQPIGIKDNFFHLGGHSLLAFKLFAEIEKAFQTNLPLSVIFQAPTVEKLAQVLRCQGEISPWNSLVLIKSGGAKQPLFLVHDANGEILLYRNLAFCLDGEQPVYGLRPYGKEGFPILHTRIKEMAAHYIQQMRTVQAKGPYLVGGLCAGGVLAFEIACQLQAQGEEIALVALLDASDVHAPIKKGRMNRQRLHKLSQVWNQSQQLKGGRKLFYLLKTVLKKVTNTLVYETSSRLVKLQNKFKVKLYRYYLDNRLPVPKFLQNISFPTIYEFTAHEYTPPTYQGQVVLLRATETVIDDNPSIDDTPLLEQVSDPLLGWGKRATGGVQVYDLPGGHSSMLQEPYVQFLAEKLENHLK